MNTHPTLLLVLRSLPLLTEPAIELPVGLASDLEQHVVSSEGEWSDTSLTSPDGTERVTVRKREAVCYWRDRPAWEDGTDGMRWAHFTEFWIMRSTRRPDGRFWHGKGRNKRTSSEGAEALLDELREQGWGAVNRAA